MKKCETCGYEIIGIPRDRLRLICRALGVFSGLSVEAIKENTFWTLPACQEAQKTARDEFQRLRRLIHDESKA